MWIVLNEVEQRLAQHLAKRRHEANRASHAVNRKMGQQSDADTDLEGIAAEIAFCKLMNVYPDMNLDERPPEDCHRGDGRSVDVKTTPYASGRLIAVPWKKPNVDLFVLMVGRFPRYRCVGSMSAAELLQQKRLGDLGHGQTFIAEQSELHHE